ncbi:DUF3083 family protein [Colwelliaceae bacterium 6471]
MSISRMRNTQHKVYIPSSARENQYLLAKFEITDEIIDRFSNIIEQTEEKPYEQFYQTLSKIFFNINNELELDSGQFIANDKFTRVRFSPEKLTSQTKQQILFLYNPSYHHSQSAYFDGNVRAKKINLVFLANGNEIRLNAAKFHRDVKKAICAFAEQIGLDKNAIRLCDHQHLTYDLFAKDKGVVGTQTHKIRSMTNRYLADDLVLPPSIDALTYAIVDIPMNKRMKLLVDLDETNSEPYHPLYNLIADTFTHAAKRYNLNNGAVIANGLIPIVRKSDDEIVVANGELQMLGYNPKKSSGGYTCKWDAEKLVDSVQLVFVASEHNETSHGFGKFLHQIESALHAIAEKIGYENDKEEMLVRFHQHLGFYLD